MLLLLNKVPNFVSTLNSVYNVSALQADRVQFLFYEYASLCEMDNYVYVHVCMHIYIYLHMCIYIYVNICIKYNVIYAYF